MESVLPEVASPSPHATYINFRDLNVHRIFSRTVNFHRYFQHRSRGSIVGVTTDYGLDY
jgi:hypothetical protein